MIRALRYKPTINVHCCRFHLAQSWMRKFKKSKILHLYRNKNSVFGLWLKALFSLPTVSSEKLSQFYFEHKANLCINHWKRVDKSLDNQFMKYLEKYYVGQNPKFPPE